jgi:hypothetical protein
MFSPTYFVVHKAQINKKLDRARADKDLRAMQEALRELTALMHAYYGAPSTCRTA